MLVNIRIVDLAIRCVVNWTAHWNEVDFKLCGDSECGVASRDTHGCGSNDAQTVAHYSHEPATDRRNKRTYSTHALCDKF